ncbi:uncharacterized protein [Spinacia oleracea]|uniref:Integrase catalytic domain-containing protein n=1 Tax=Spinacia oleracea TaxID=3562 RepID=A0ABM3RR42_SPIOL|nr:uncharacterized protein LOC130459141 [Spinacia oleracea]
MPFGLKNAPTTFQQRINTVFSKQLGQNIEASIDDMIVKEREVVQMPAYFVSHVLQNAELRYPTVEKFGLALFLARKKLRPYFLAHRLVVYNDHPLKLPFTKLEAAGRMLNWAIKLNAFDISYEPRKAIKGQALADFIVGMTRPNFPRDRMTLWTVLVDDSSTQNGCGVGIIFQSPEGDTYEYAMHFKFQASNNELEYEALLCGIQMWKAVGAEEILALPDSQLVVHQVNRDYEARDPTMIKYMNVVHQEVEHLKIFKVKQVPRSENNQADALSKLVSSASCDTPRHVFCEVLDQKSIEQNETEVLDRMSTWMDNIINFKMNGEILEDLHQGLCSSHIGGRALAVKALRTGYYLPTLREYALSLVKRCDKCQRFSHLIHRPAQILTPITSPIPFSKWGMDLLGPYIAAPGGRSCVVVVVDYFTKWVEAEALRNINTYDVKAFIWVNIITRFGVPQSIVFYNGPQFETPKLREWLVEHGIAGHFASVGRPQANGQVKSFNKIIYEGMKRKLDEAKGLWEDELPNFLWSIRITAKNSTGETPFLLAYGGEAVLPIEMCEPMLRVMLYDEKANREMMKVALDFWPEVRGNASMRQQLYKLRMGESITKSHRVLTFCNHAAATISTLPSSMLRLLNCNCMSNFGAINSNWIFMGLQNNSRKEGPEQETNSSENLRSDECIMPICLLKRKQMVLVVDEENANEKLVMYNFVEEDFKDIVVHGIPETFGFGGSFMETLVSPHCTNEAVFSTLGQLRILIMILTDTYMTVPSRSEELLAANS